MPVNLSAPGVKKGPRGPWYHEVVAAGVDPKLMRIGARVVRRTEVLDLHRVREVGSPGPLRVLALDARSPTPRETQEVVLSCRSGSVSSPPLRGSGGMLTRLAKSCIEWKTPLKTPGRVTWVPLARPWSRCRPGGSSPGTTTAAAVVPPSWFLDRRALPRRGQGQPRRRSRRTFGTSFSPSRWLIRSAWSSPGWS